MKHLFIMTILGIDLGNYNTKIYKLVNGQPEIILTKESRRLFPTIINFYNENKEIIRKTLDENTYDYIKEYKNRIYNIPELISDKKELYPYNYLDNNFFIQSHLSNKHIKTHLIVILLIYIKYLINCDDIQVVMTFSNNINYKCQEIIHNAFKILDIKLLGLISSTIANSIDYGFPLITQKKFNTKPFYTLFLDFGYINCKISVVNYENNKIQEIYTKDNIKIGSYFLDCKLLDYLINDFWLKFNIDLNKYPKHKIQLFRLCEKIRKDFSMNKISNNIINFFIDEKEIDFKINLTLEEYNTFFTIFKKKIVQHLDILKNNYPYIDEIIVTGGFYRVSIIKDIICKYFSIPIKTILNLEESAAKGCTILCALIFKSLKTNVTIPIELKVNTPIYIKYNNYQSLLVITEKDLYPINKQITIKKIENINFTFSYNNKNFFFLDKFVVPDNNMLPNIGSNLNVKKIDYIKVKFYYGFDNLIKIKEYKIKYLQGNSSNIYIIQPKPKKLNIDLLEIKNKEINNLAKKKERIKVEKLKNEIETEYYKKKKIFIQKNKMDKYNEINTIFTNISDNNISRLNILYEKIKNIK